MASSLKIQSVPKVTIVTDCSKSRQIVTDLKMEKVVAVDAEGINLGKDGSLTLLQIGKCNGEVFLFDIHTNKSLFDAGNLKAFLESLDDPVKVFHSCYNDSYALFFQFNVRLRNVHDTQVADMILEEKKGKKLPHTLKLIDVCKKYSETPVTTLGSKEVVKDKWVHDVWNYWECRPLTAEMISYASEDVLALIPEVYENQCKVLSTNGLMAKFEERVHERIMFQLEESFRKMTLDRINENVMVVLQSIVQRYPASITLEEIDDDDTIEALKRIYFNQVSDYPSIVGKLKKEFIRADFMEIQNELKTSGDKYVPNRGVMRRLGAFRKHPDLSIVNKAKELKTLISKVVMKGIRKKYPTGTPVTSIREVEREALEDMYPRSENDPNYEPELLSLYWQMKESNLDDSFKKYIGDRTQPFPEWMYKSMCFYVKAAVPRTLKRKAEKYIQEINSDRKRSSRR